MSLNLNNYYTHFERELYGSNYGNPTMPQNKYESELQNIADGNAPIPQDALASHNEWVEQRRPWSGHNRIKQAPIEAQPPSGWLGMRLPEPVPQNPKRAQQLTEYSGPDFEHWITTNRRKTGNPVYLPDDMMGLKQNYSNDGYLPYGY